MRKLSQEEKTQQSVLQPLLHRYITPYHVDVGHITIDYDAVMMKTLTITPASRAAEVDEQMMLSSMRYRQRKLENRLAKAARDAAKKKKLQKSDEASLPPDETAAADLRDTVRAFYRVNADWVSSLSDHDDANLQQMIANQLNGSISSSDFRHFVRDLKETVIGPQLSSSPSSSSSSSSHQTNWAAGGRIANGW